MNPETIIGITYITAGSIGYLMLWRRRRQWLRLKSMARRQAARHNDYLSSLQIS